MAAFHMPRAKRNLAVCSRGKEAFKNDFRFFRSGSRQTSMKLNGSLATSAEQNATSLSALGVSKPSGNAAVVQQPEVVFNSRTLYFPGSDHIDSHFQTSQHRSIQGMGCDCSTLWFDCQPDEPNAIWWICDAPRGRGRYFSKRFEHGSEFCVSRIRWQVGHIQPHAAPS
jgi:hypothetical protein